MAADLVGWFEAQLRLQVMLAFFLPGIVYPADAVGTQTETVIVRGLSVGVHLRRVVGRELLTGLVIGVALGLIALPLVWWRWGEGALAVGVALSLLAACSTATLAAMSLPWLLDRLGLDPAFGSGPLATVVQDLLSIVIYLRSPPRSSCDTRPLTMVRAEDLAQAPYPGDICVPRRG
jgi:magnesium transporter